MQINSIGKILNYVRIAGELALDAQSKMNFHERSYKSDGSVFTITDKNVEDYLFKEISREYPDANILTEETIRSFDPKRPYTFAIDPIDGTDAFSQGMPGWCVSLGVLDQELIPIAGIIFAPRWDSLFFADIGKRAICNEKEILLSDTLHSLSSKANIMVPSDIHKHITLRNYPGKIRNVGSAALHLCFPLIYPAVIGTISGRVHIWDIAAGHAINLSVGLNLEFLDGGKLEYSDMVDGSRATDLILSGSKQTIGQLRNALERI